MRTRNISITALIALLVLAFAIPVQSQDKERKEKMSKERKEDYARIKSAKIAFITEHVNLTPEEAEKFWPVYNEMENKRQELTQNLMKRFRGDQEDVEMSNEQAEKLMQSHFAKEQELLDLKKVYHKKYSAILPATKIAKLYKAENRFKGMLMERLKYKDGERRNAGTRGRAPDGEGRKAPDNKKIESN